MAQKSGQEEKSIKDLKPIYLIHGDEQLLLDEAVTRLKDGFAQEGDLDFNYDQFFGDRDSVHAVIQAAQTVPFMSPKRLILLKDADKLASADIKTLVEYLDSPSPTTCLVLVAGKLKKTSPLYKAADKRGQIFEYKLTTKKEYPNWVKKRFRKEGKIVTDRASSLLVESVGHNLHRLEREIEKISLFYVDNVQISEEDISTLMCESSEKNIFDLVDSIGKRDKNNAFLFLKQLMDKNTDPPQIIFFMIVRQFRLLLMTKSLLDRGLTDQAISRELKVPFFVAKKLGEQCGNFSLEKLQAIYRLLAEVDVALKTSERKPRLLLEDLVVKIMD